MPQRFTVSYASAEAFLEAYDVEMANGGLLVRGAQAEAGARACEVELKLVAEPLGVVSGEILMARRTGVAVQFDDLPASVAHAAERLKSRLRLVPDPPATPEPAQRGTAADRIAQLTVPQKIQLALSGDRESRLVLLRDHNKVLHPYVLRNPRIGLDEVTFAAKLATLAPDALKLVSEHAEWSANPQICSALVRNVATPTPVALRLLPRLSSIEVRTLAKGGARDAIVQAARKLIAGP